MRARRYAALQGDRTTDLPISGQTKNGQVISWPWTADEIHLDHLSSSADGAQFSYLLDIQMKVGNSNF